MLALLLAAALALVGSSPPAVGADSPFAVTMTPSASTVASGQQLTYTIDVTNTGGSVADDVQLDAQINGMTGLILTSNVGTCTQTDNAVSCDAGILQGFQSWRVTIRGTVTAADGTTLFNGVTVTGNHESNGYETSVHSSVLVSNAPSGPLPDLRVSVQGPTTVADNTEVIYQLTVNNTGTANATDVTVVNTLPTSFAFTSVSATSLFACANQPVGSLTVVCTGGRVNAGANATITIKANSNSQLDGSQLKNTAVVDPYDMVDESNELNNTGALISVNGLAPTQTGLTITKADAPDPLRPGDLLTYSIIVKNTAATRADNVVMTDVTQGLDAASITATTDRGACTVTAPKVTCTQKSPTLRLNPGEQMTIEIKGIVTAAAGSLITNTATASGVIKNKASTNTARTTTTVYPGVDLTVVQQARTNHEDADTTPGDTDPFRAWDHFQYDIAVGNSGLDTADNVLLRQLLAPEVTFLDDDRVDVDCAQSGRVVTCTLPAVQGTQDSGNSWGSVENLTLYVVAPPTPRTIDATVTVDPANSIFEPDETNNVWSVSTPIRTGIDLTVQKSSPSPVSPSGNLLYTIVVSNIGTQDAEGVVVRDVLPAGTRFRSAKEDIPAQQAGHNFTCTHDGSASGGVVECTGGRIRGTHDHAEGPLPPPQRYFAGHLPVETVTIKVLLFAPAAPGIIRNQVWVDPGNQVDERLEHNNNNTYDTDIKIVAPPEADPYPHAYHEFTIDKKQVDPADPAAIAPSGIIKYDVVVTNLGSDVAFDVTVEDVMPPGTAFISADDTTPGTGDFQCSGAGGVIRCIGGTLDGSKDQAQSPITRTIHVELFAPSQPGDYVNRAVIDPDNTHPEADETNNSDQVTTKVAMGGANKYVDFQIDSVQTSPAGDVVPSGALQYELTVTNNSAAVAYNVKVRDTLPDGAVFRSAQDKNPGPGAFECSAAGGVVTCTGGTLDGALDQLPGDDNIRVIVIEVFAPPEPNTYYNTAMVDPDQAIAEADEANNTDVTTTNVRLNGGGTYRDLVIDKIDLTVTQPKPGQEYTYTVTTKNLGSNPAYNVVLRNVLDDGATFVSATAQNDFTCAISANVLTCDGGALDGGAPGAPDLDPTYDADADITITVRAPMRHDYTYWLTSRIDPGNAIPEANEANNSKTKDAKVMSQVNLKSEISSTGSQGSTGSVTFKATNTAVNGAGETARDVYLVAELPVGVIPQNLGTVEAGWSCQIEENPINKVTCHGDLAAGATATFTVSTYVTGSSITGNAYVDPANAVVESIEGDNASNG